MNEGWVIPAFAGVLGLLFGSFLNVCALRWGPEPEPGEKRKSVVFPASHCPECEATLAWYDNVPVLSWLLLRGRCRHCAHPISVQYPIVELTTGLIWAGSFASFGPTPEAGRGAFFLTVLLGISVTDARFYIIPDEFSVGGAVVGFGLAFLPGGIGWLDSLIGAGVGYSVLLLIGVVGTWAIKKLSPGRLEAAGVEQAMGGGDIKMMMMIGAFLGVWGVALTIFLGSILALLVFGPISAISKRLIPLGVFLAAGGGVAYAFGDVLVRWYLVSVVGLPGG